MQSHPLRTWPKSFTDTGLMRYLLRFRPLRQFLSFIGPDYVCVESEGACYHCSLVEHLGVNHFLLKNHHYEPFITKIIVDELAQHNDAAFLDIGANIGYFTVLAAKRTQATVYAIEPDPTLCAEITANAGLNRLSNVVIHNVALCEASKQLQLFRSKKNRGDNRAYAFDESRTEGLLVKGIRGDELFTAKEFEGIRLIKIDVQGFEYKVLLGLKSYLQNAVNLTIISELEIEMLSKAGDDPKTYLMFLADLGFETALLNEDQQQIVPADIPTILNWAHRHKTTNILLKK